MLPQARWRNRRRWGYGGHRHLPVILLLSLQIYDTAAIVYPINHDSYKFDYLHNNNTFSKGLEMSVSKRVNPIPLIVTNQCPDTIWPGIATQYGEGPESSGFVLGPCKTRKLTVGPTWQGRVWGRTNCTVDGDTATCDTGDCANKLDCEFPVGGIGCCRFPLLDC